jgi:hypothetical protein
MTLRDAKTPLTSDRERNLAASMRFLISCTVVALGGRLAVGETLENDLAPESRWC